MSIVFVYLLSLLNGTSVFASQMVLSLYALDLGASALTVGVLAGMFSLFPMLLAVHAGKMIDRAGARWPMVCGTAAGGIGLLIPYFIHAIPALFIASVMQGLSIVFFHLATQNLVGLLATAQNRARYFSNYTLTISTAQFLGPLAGGFLIDHTGFAATCLAMAVLALLPAALLAWRGQGIPGGTRKPAAAGGTGGGIRRMLADPVVQRMLVTGCLLSAGLNLYLMYMPVYGHLIGLSASGIGIVMATNSTAAFVVRAMLPQLLRRFGEDRVLTYAFLMSAVGLLLIPFFKSVAPLAAVSFVFGLGMGCGQPIIIMLMFANSADGRSAEALGLKFTTNQATKFLSPMLFGVIASVIGLPPTFWLNATLMAGGGALSWVFRKKA